MIIRYIDKNETQDNWTNYCGAKKSSRLSREEEWERWARGILYPRYVHLFIHSTSCLHCTKLSLKAYLWWKKSDLDEKWERKKIKSDTYIKSIDTVCHKGLRLCAQAINFFLAANLSRARHSSCVSTCIGYDAENLIDNQGGQRARRGSRALPEEAGSLDENSLGYP